MDIFGLNFETDFITWISGLTLFQILGVLAFAGIDLGRSAGKAIVLIIHYFISRTHIRIPVTNRPKITVLVPAHNEGENLKRTIISIVENNYPNKEIIVIDDHSSDDTFRIADEFAKKGLIRIVRRKEGKGSRAAAINFGVVYATGDILMMTDGDTLIERKVLKEIAKLMDDPKVGAVAGNVRVLGGDDGVNNILTKCQAYEYIIAFELGRRVLSIMNLLLIIPGAFGAFRKDLAKKAGIYDKDTLAEDFDLSIKVFKTGTRVMFVSDAIAWTFCPYSWKGWFRQRLRWTHGQIITLRKHKDIISSRNVVYKTSFIIGILDMIFMDVVLLIMRFISLIWIVFFGFTENLIYASVLLAIFYLLNELMVILISAICSPHKDDLRYVYLLPFVFLVYRPVYAVIRMYAIITAFLGKDIKW
jgi:cellulose synthase/poly-beta-1,6-N-acetylglucosamine synthase-like glycosyltransferase